MAHPTPYERLGGAVGIDAGVRAVHDRVLSDPDRSTLVAADAGAADAALAADAATLARVLGGPAGAGVGRDAGDGLLLADPDVARRHLADALWLLGTSSSLVAEVVDAVLDAQGRTDPLRT